MGEFQSTKEAAARVSRRRQTAPGGSDLVVTAGEIALAGAGLFVMDGLGHLHLTALRFLGLLAGMSAALAAAAAAGEGWRRRLAALALVGLALAAGDRVFGLKLPAAVLAYAAIGQTLAGITYRRLLARVGGNGARGAEAARLLGATLAGLAVVLPFATDRFIGGSDARWYGYMMADFLQQARAGVFPVFVGQGEFAFNGGIHPFRSAPLHLWLGGALDLLTARALSVLALQHLTVLASSVGASLGMYLALTALAPARRGTALVVAVLFTFCPAQLAAIHAAEAYMTFMTFPWLVLAFYGAARTFETAGTRGWWQLAAGLVLSWLGHPSVGALATIAVCFLQAVRLAAEPWSRATWLRAGAAGALLVLGLMYYFVGMKEAVSAVTVPISGRPVLILLGIGVLPLVLWLGETGRLYSAAASGAAITAVLWRVRPALGIFSLLAVLLQFGLAAWSRTRRSSAGPARRAERIGAVLLAAAVAAALMVGRDFAGKGPTTNDSLRVARDALRSTLAPVPGGAASAGSFQFGWGVILLFLLGLAGGISGRTALQRALALAVALFGLLYIPLPHLAEFLWGNLPDLVVSLTSIAFDRRLMPVMAVLAGFAGFVALRDPAGDRWRRRAVWLLALALPWSAWEAAKFVRRGYAVTNTWAQTKLFYRGESAWLTRYAYDLLKIPAYMSHGIMDYRLESRVLNDGDFSLRLGPDQYAAAMEKPAETRTLAGRPSEPGSAWLQFQPPLVVRPGEDFVLRFQFAPGLTPGYFILPGVAGLYREYQLPDSGYPKSFGSGPQGHRVITLRNTGSAVEQFNWEYSRSSPGPAGEREVDFARVAIARFDGSVLPVRVTSLLPYRATVTLDRAGWLETFRCWLPGYQATIDGEPAPVRESPEHLVMLPVAAGRTEVELRYVGTPRLRTAFAISCAAALGLIAWGVGETMGERRA